MILSFKMLHEFDDESPIDCRLLFYLAYAFGILLVSSVILNSLLLYTFYKCSVLHAPRNYFMITITFFNLIGAIGIFPFQIISYLNCRFVPIFKNLLNFQFKKIIIYSEFGSTWMLVMVLKNSLFCKTKFSPDYILRNHAINLMRILFSLP